MAPPMLFGRNGEAQYLGIHFYNQDGFYEIKENGNSDERVLFWRTFCCTTLDKRGRKTGATRSANSGA